MALLAPSGETVLRYTDLFATDADGRVLRASMQVEGAAIRLVVDDDAARYPLTIDPLTWIEQTKLLASDGVGGDLFAYSVSVSGDTAVVAAVLHDDSGADSGSAYVFARSGSTWSEQAKLLASDGAGGDLFGGSLLVSGGRRDMGGSAIALGRGSRRRAETTRA